MFTTLFNTSDITSSALAAATMGCFAASGLLALGLSWAAERWRIAIALSAVAMALSGFYYFGATEVWIATGKASAGPRFATWAAVHPLLVAAAYFFANVTERVPPGVFWRTTVAALLMTLSRYLGDAQIFNPTLGVLLSIAFWLYILGEMYFGKMSETVRKATRPVQLGYFWIRLIMTIGWAIIPILHFVDVVIGTGHVAPIVILYTVADAVNLITLSLIYIAVSGKERY
jgi:sensory rhodopsin